MACNKTNYVGRDVVLEYLIGCGDAVPEEDSWKRFGVHAHQRVHPRVGNYRRDSR